MKHVRTLALVLTAILTLAAGCGRPTGPTVSALKASPPQLPSTGGPTSLTWSGANSLDFQLGITPGTGVSVDGKPYSGNVDLATTDHAGLVLPANPTGKARSYTVTLSASGFTGTTPATETATLTVGATGPSITALEAGPSALPSGGGVTTVRWSGNAVNDYRLTVSPSSGVTVGGTPYRGSVDLGAATTATVALPANPNGSGSVYQLTLTASGAKGTAQATRALAIAVGPADPTITSFAAAAPSLSAAGGTASLTWTGVAISDYQLAVSPTSGVSVNGVPYAGPVDLQSTTSAGVALPANATSQSIPYTFTLTASGATGTSSATKEVRVSVGPADPAITAFTASPATLTTRGGTSTVTWSGTAVTDYQLSVSPSSSVAVDGAPYSGPIDLHTATSATVTLPGNMTSSDAVYTLTLTAAGGSGTTGASAVRTVTVNGHTVTVYYGSLYGFQSPRQIVVDDLFGVVAVGNGTPGAAGNGTITVFSYQGTPRVSTLSTVDTGSADIYPPFGLAVDHHGSLWFTSQANDTVAWVLGFDLMGSTSTSNGATGFSGSPYSFNAPVAVAVDASNNIWVANSGGNSVTEFPASNGPSGPAGTIHTYTSGFNQPGALAVDPSGNVWVVNTGDGTVTELPAANRGSPRRLPVSFAKPMAIAADGAGNIWVANETGDSVTELPAGSATSPRVFHGFHAPVGIAADSKGNIWVTNEMNGTVSELPAGHPSQPRVFGSPDFPFVAPWGITVDAQDNVWVTDAGGNNVVEFH